MKLQSLCYSGVFEAAVMISSIVSRLVILVFGTLYPAYASYKAVRTKNVKEYVKWMMYWIVFALFTCAETFTDVFLSFWFPFYYEIKVILVLWLLSPATKGSSILYRKFVHPMLCRREQDIDEYIAKAKEQGYHTVLHLGTKGVNYATTVIMQTAIKGGGGLVQQLRRSYSLSDLSTDKDMADVNRNSKALSNVPDDDTDEADEGSIDPRMLRSRGYSPRRSASGSGRVEMYFPEVDVDVRQHTSRQREPSIPLSHIRSSEDVSSGYSSAEPLYAGHHTAKGESLGPAREPLMRTASVGSTRSMRPKGSRGGVVSKRTPTTEGSERWSNEEADFSNQEEYSYVISTSLPSQLASIPPAEQPLTQTELFLLLQQLHSLKTQSPSAPITVETVENECQIMEVNLENRHEVSDRESSAVVNNGDHQPAVNESIEIKSDFSVDGLKYETISVVDIPTTETIGNVESKTELNIAVDKPKTDVSIIKVDELKTELTEAVQSKSEPTITEGNTNSSIDDVDVSELFVDAHTLILNDVQGSGSKVDIQSEFPLSEDTLVDTNTDLDISHMNDSSECLPAIAARDRTECSSVTTITTDTTLAFDSEKNMDELPTQNDEIASESAQFEELSTTSSLKEQQVQEKNSFAPSENLDAVSDVKEQVQITALCSTEVSVLPTANQGCSTPLVTLNETTESPPNANKTATSVNSISSSSTFQQMNSSGISEASVDLNESTETLKPFEELHADVQSEMSSSTADVACTSEKKDIRSGRYHKHHAPAPPEKSKEYSADEAMKNYGNENVVDGKTTEMSSANIQTAVTARLVLQPGIVKSFGPETSGNITQKFISSSPKVIRKSTSRTKAKQKGSAISRLLVMPKNQLGHLASYLPFWGNRDVKSKSSESVSSGGSEVDNQTRDVSTNSKKENVSLPPLPPSTLRPAPMSSCSLEYLPFIEGSSKYDSYEMDRGRSNSISNFKIREMSHSPPAVRRTKFPY